MDAIQGMSLNLRHIRLPLTTQTSDWAAHLLGDNHAALQTYAPYLRQMYSFISTAQSYITPLLNQVSRNPDLATVALLLVILFVSLKILNMLWQTVLFWLRLVRKVAFWGGLSAFALWMYTRGPDGVWQDVEYWMQVWGQEHNYWKDKERAARMARQGRGGTGKGGGGGMWF